MIKKVKTMPNDISTEINIIRNSARGEDVRDAIISLFRKVNESSIGVTITREQYENLSEEEKNNGIMYFVSDMSVEYGEETYYGDYVGTATHVIISKETVLNIINTIRASLKIDANLKLSHIPSLLPIMTIMVPRIAHLLTGSYNSGKIWYYYPNSAKKYTIDIYRVPVGDTYIIGIGAHNGNTFYASIFKTNPLEATANITDGVSIVGTSNPAQFAVAKISVEWTDIEYAYIAIRTSTNSNQEADSFVVRGSSIETSIQALIETHDDETDDED